MSVKPLVLALVMATSTSVNASMVTLNDYYTFIETRANAFSFVHGTGNSFQFSFAHANNFNFWDCGGDDERRNKKI